MSGFQRRSPIAYEAATSLTFEAAVAAAREALQREGFGVLTEIDVAATMKRKLGHDLPPYLILGACHPPSALRALSVAPDAGVLLPCNVTISVEGTATVVRAMDPAAVMGLVAKPELAEVGAEVGRMLQRVVSTVAGSATAAVRIPKEVRPAKA